MARDSQRQKLFMAQRSCKQHKFNTPLDAEIFVREVVRSRWWRARCQTLTPENISVEFPRSTQSCGVLWSGKPVTHVIYYAHSDLEALHALTHYLVRTGNPGQDLAWHGREFARTYLEMVKRFIGPEAGKELRSQFTTHKVRARVISDETKEKHRENFIERKAGESSKRLLSLARELTDEEQDA